MSKMEQLLKIEPESELKFKGPFTSSVTSYLKISNPTHSRICFKIKTTAPKKYCVRPNAGILEPDGSIEIAVSLQPFDFDANEKNKHKFMVQSVIIPNGEVNTDAIWKETNVDNYMSSKLKCVFEMPGEAASIQLQNNVEFDDKKKIPDVAVGGGTIPETELIKASKEVKSLREEVSVYRQENIQLKEEVLKLLKQQQQQQQVQQAQSAIGGFKPNHTLHHQLANNNQMLPVLYIGTGIFIGLLAMLIVKYIF